MEEKRCFALKGKEYPYILHRKKVKNINLRVKNGGEISVSAPRTVPLSVIENFLHRKEGWILSALEKEAAVKPVLPKDHVYLCGELIQLPEGCDRLSWQKMMANQLLPTVYEQAWQLFEEDGFPKPTLKLRRMKSRWGSCMPSKGIITLNTALVGASKECQIAVAAHELCHMLHPNHSKDFYNSLLNHYPSYMDCWQKLKQAQAFLFYS